MLSEHSAKIYQIWKSDPFFDEDTRRELEGLSEAEIEARFSGELAFGTGGLRGVMGAGTNRINRYVVGRATLGLGRMLLEKYGAEQCRERGVAVGYDTRLNSREYAGAAAQVLSGLGVKALLFAGPCPTPQLSFAIRELGCIAGVVITASHNPVHHNGYKVYDDQGCQMVPCQIAPVADEIRRIKDVREVSFAGDPALIGEIDLTEEYVSAAVSRSLFNDRAAKAALSVVYTPLHGTGLIPVCRALEKDGFDQVHLVESQAAPDGRFPGVKLPNPEEKEALEAGMALAEAISADLVLGTDPDADRVGLAVRTEDGFWQPDGNQVGALLADFVLLRRDLTKMKRPVALNTVVSSQLGAQIAKSFGAQIVSTLTGFKYIGEMMTRFEEERRADADGRSFLMGYEESCGYLAVDYVRDKDGVSTAMLLCEAAAYWKKQGLTLRDRMDQLYEQFGYEETRQIRLSLDGGAEKGRMQEYLNLFAAGGAFEERFSCEDYRRPAAGSQLPAGELVKLVFEDGSWAAIRPSGTEAKVKIYLSARGAGRRQAEERLQALTDGVKRTLNQR